MRRSGLVAALPLVVTVVSVMSVSDAFSATEQRIAGRDRYETSAMIAEAGWASTPRVIVARGDDFPDALAAAGITQATEGRQDPILLTRRDGFDDAASALIRRLGVREAVILGSEGVVGPEVQRDLDGRGVAVVRLAGRDRYETAVAAAASVFDGDDPPGAIDGGRTVVVTSGESFADALAVGPLASAMRLPIVLTRRDVLPAATRAHLDGPFGDSIDQVLVVGGTAVVSDEIVAEIEAMGHAVRRVAGGTRYETSSRIADLFADELFVPDDVVVARGDVFADALAAAPYAGSMGAPVLLAGDGTAPAWVADHDVDRVRLLGPAVLDPVPAATRWDPRVGDTWHLQLQGDLVTDLDVDVYDVDLFDTPASTIASLQADGRRVVCYFSAGSWEEWRPDADDWPEEAIGEPLDGWEGERWIDVRRLDLVGPVLGARLDLAEAKGCDGVDPDNVDGYDGHETGFDLDSNDTLVFVRHLVSEGHERSLAVGLKNALALVPTLADEVDFAVNEQCVAFDECDRLAPLAVHDAPVFGVEYDGSFDEVCAAAEDVGSWLLADLELDGRSRTCRTG